MAETFTNGPITLIHGDGVDHMKRGQYDAIITDPPYSEKTHAGQSEHRRGVEYEPGSVAVKIAEIGAQHCGGWICIITDDVLSPTVIAALGQDPGRKTFAPVSIVYPDSVRLSGDGPASGCVWMCVSRPRSMSRCGSLPGHYMSTRRKGAPIIGAKQIQLMRQIVRDYTRLGDLVFDPCAGTGTTLISAAIEGRRAIGCEIDRETFDYAVKQIKKGYTPTMF